jgi:peptidoglycan hydrolase CwlO-like protein
VKLPSLRNIERVVRMVPVVKDLIPSNKDGLNSFEILKLNKKIKEQDNALYAKKQEIAILKSKIELLQETIGGYQS